MRILLLNFFLLIAFSQTSWAWEIGMDSIGLTKKEDKFFILHKVMPRETLSGIAKRYKISLLELKNANSDNEKMQAQLKKNEIKSGQILLVPARQVSLPPTSTLAINKRVTSAKGKKIAQWHTVKGQESLYKIAHQYNLHIDTLKAWNQLVDNSIKASSKLLVGYQTQDEEYEMPAHVPLKEEIGMGELITGTSNTNLKLALHRSLPTGTYVRVSHETTGASVVVKIIGKIQQVDADDKVIIKLSQAACKKLGTVNDRFPVTIMYEKKKK